MHCHACSCIVMHAHALSCMLMHWLPSLCLLTQTILHKDIIEGPRVDCLMPWYDDGFTHSHSHHAHSHSLTLLQTILDKDIIEWPRVDCLMSWYSDGFPLAKAQSYADLTRPFLINDLNKQVRRGG
jgi:hypothetical protein